MSSEESQPETRRYGTTANGEKYHIVPNSESMLALGKTEKESNYRSLCGVVPDEWEFTLDAPDREDVCRQCLPKNVGEA